MSITAESPTAAQRRFAISEVPYLPGLDGLRAIAFIAVMLYHADLPSHTTIPWMKGGFVGVEVFFVISGYLITLLMVAEEERHGSIFTGDVPWWRAGWRRLWSFWVRRLRRLVPAMLVLVAAVTAASGLLGYLRVEAKDKLGWSPVCSLFYVNNWCQIGAGVSYSDENGRPPLLRHLWSLAVEEQFYIVWPILMLVLLGVFWRKQDTLGVALFGFALLLAANTAALFHAGVNWNLLYLGTQSRMSGIILGSSMALFWRPHALARSRLRGKGHLLSAVGVAGLAMLLWAMVTFETNTADGGGDPALFTWGMPFVGVATTMVIASASHLGSWFGQRALSVQPLKWIGTRSYGLYLWHFPVFQLMRPGEPGAASAGDINLPFWVVMALRCAVTLAVTDLSYRFVETPIRRGLLRNVFKPARLSRRLARRRLPLMLAGAACFIVPLAGTAAIIASDGCYDVERALGECGADAGDDTLPSPLDPGSAPPETSPLVSAPGASAPSSTPASTPATTPASSPIATVAPKTAPPTTAKPRLKYFAVGDSVMLGAQRPLFAKGVWVDARKNRQMREAVEVIDDLVRQRLIGEVVVVHIGTNGKISQNQVDNIMQLTKSAKRVVWVTVRVESKTWQDPNNAIIRGIPKKYPDRDVRIVDWNAATKTRSNVFCSDGIHLCKGGPAFYTALLVKAISAK